MLACEWSEQCNQLDFFFLAQTIAPRKIRDAPDAVISRLFNIAFNMFCHKKHRSQSGVRTRDGWKSSDGFRCAPPLQHMTGLASLLA